MFEPLLTDDESFLALQERWETFPNEDTDLLELDPKILPICQAINRLPGLVTIYAMISHPSMDKPECNLMLGVVKEGFAALIDLFSHIQSFANDPGIAILRCQSSLRFHRNRRLWKVGSWYNSVTINVRMRSADQRIDFIKHLTNYFEVKPTDQESDAD